MYISNGTRYAVCPDVKPKCVMNSEWRDKKRGKCIKNQEIKIERAVICSLERQLNAFSRFE